MNNELNHFREQFEGQPGPQVIITCVKLIKSQFIDLKRALPWSPKPEDLTPDKFKISHGLDQLLLILVKDGRNND